MGQRIVVAGGTGYIGQHVVRELLARGHSVTVLSRPRAGVRGQLELEDVKRALPGAEVVAAQVTDPDDVNRALEGRRCDAIFSCLASRSGTPADAWVVDCEANRTLLRQASRLEASQFVLLSAMCVQKPLLEFQRAKLAFERELIASPIIHSIVRPTAFFKSLAGQIRRVRDGRPFLLLGDGKMTACKPISERDLSHFMAECLTDPSKHNAVLPVGGPGPAITPRRQGELLFSLLGREPRFKRVPLWVFDLISGGLSLASWIIPPLKNKAELAKIGRYYATESMLVWDEKRGCYDENATPSHGGDTLESFYREALDRENPAAELGDHSVFS